MPNSMVLRNLLIAAALACSAAHAADRKVRIFFAGNYANAASVPASAINTILFLKEPCALDVVNGRNMLRAWMALGSHQLGCWYPTIGDGYVMIDGFGNEHASRVYWESFPHAWLHADGTATIDEPGFTDMASFMAQVDHAKLMQEISSHQHDKP